jgi:hypothetical protein
MGMPGARMVVIPSPLATRSAGEVRQMARDYAPEIVALVAGR